jgi:hypothetical protein
MNQLSISYVHPYGTVKMSKDSTQAKMEKKSSRDKSPCGRKIAKA